MTDRGLKKKHHRMTPIKHFLIDFIQIIFRDIIEITIGDIGHCKATTDIFQKTLRNFFYKRWPIIFSTVEEALLFGVAVKIFYVGRLGFFVRAQRSCVLADTGMFSIAWKGKRSPTSEKNI